MMLSWAGAIRGVTNTSSTPGRENEHVLGESRLNWENAVALDGKIIQCQCSKSLSFPVSHLIKQVLGLQWPVSIALDKGGRRSSVIVLGDKTFSLAGES
jgi:hypothetical protein